ncbi:hypothetical protein BDY21DRAFT_378725 [Lineolata rhizophorae]|uniref:Uncharacterized protein n=1 Tax=Lineolata rhizophorae TaxID=578093 RepID=A0A6A6P4F3_9PEZI|nr:hypothetical protein BDY21DRAFT_378725 [Lineolata rhizophorae]
MMLSCVFVAIATIARVFAAPAGDPNELNILARQSPGCNPEKCWQCYVDNNCLDENGEHTEFCFECDTTFWCECDGDEAPQDDPADECPGN